MSELPAFSLPELKHGHMDEKHARAAHISPKAMSAAAYVADARQMSIELEDDEALEQGNVDRARAYIARHFGIAQSILYSLRRRHPKTVGADVYDKLCIAIQSVATKGISTLHHQILTATHKQLRVHHDHIRAGAAMLQKAREHFARLKRSQTEGR